MKPRWCPAMNRFRFFMYELYNFALHVVLYASLTMEFSTELF